MFLTRTVVHFSDALLTLAYPQACTLCRRSVENRLYGTVCQACWDDTQIFTGHETICWKCGVVALGNPAQISSETIRCGRCDSQLFDGARACGIYEGALRESALLLKRQPHVSRYMIDLLVAAAKRPPLNQATRIVPVPLHPERERGRGFNQAELIAKTIAPQLNLVVDGSSLIRVTASQKYRAGLDAKGRRDTVDQAFIVRFPQLIAGEIVLLIDDVFTTGATASSCAEALLWAGAQRVYILTIARPPR